jgi:hypothetical protein
MIMPEKIKGPVYTGMRLHPHKEGGFSVWLPSDWYKTELKPRHVGMLFSPYPDDINTCILIEKHKLKVAVKPEDVDALREGFMQGLKALSGIEIESTEEALSETIQVFDARYTFLEGEERRKRWARNIYWGNGQLVMIAQGRTPEDFDYWLPMFFNTITTAQII